MINTVCKKLIVVLLTLVFCLSLFAQGDGSLTLGPARLVNLPARTLKNPTELKIGLKRSNFVRAVGGVAFDQMATPSADTVFSKLQLVYDASKEDGTRFSIIADGRPVSAHIYDWQLIPIAKFANSRYFSCFTLFGRLADQPRLRGFGVEHARILNYHPDLVDTLLGLRLFQLDILIFKNYASDLPKNMGIYVLGKGETAPNLTANLQGREIFDQYYSQFTRRQKPQSYVISDYRRSVNFHFKEDTLTLTGEPYIYLWKYAVEMPQDEKAAKERLQNEGDLMEAAVNKLLEEERLKQGFLFNQHEWLLQASINIVRVYMRDFASEEDKASAGLLGLRTDQLRREFLRRWSDEELLVLITDLRTQMKVFRVRPLTQASDQLSSQTELLRATNPAVWDSGRAVMRYSAFFRYVKKNHPAEWKTFMTSIGTAPAVTPTVKTPTVMVD